MKVPQHVFDALRSQLDNDQQMLEATATVAAYNMVSRILVALDVGNVAESDVPHPGSVLGHKDFGTSRQPHRSTILTLNTETLINQETRNQDTKIGGDTVPTQEHMSGAAFLQRDSGM